MQKITVLCVGKLKEKFYQEAAAEYAKRLGRHCKLEIVELPESRLPEDPSAAEIQRALAAEAAALDVALTPVPGGVGSVTSAVLCKHTIQAAENTRL